MNAHANMPYIPSFAGITASELQTTGQEETAARRNEASKNPRRELPF